MAPTNLLHHEPFLRKSRSSIWTSYKVNW